jgi:hypothetical protein
MAMAKANGGNFLAAGLLIYDAVAKCHVAFDVFPHDEDLIESMWVGSGRTLHAKVMKKIEKHGSVAFLSFDRTGPDNDLDDQLRAFVGAVLKAGGLAVKVLECGMSHGVDRWDALLANDMPMGLFQTLVLQVPDRDRDMLSSFGMKQFGLPDGMIVDPGTSADPAWALFEFNIYLWQQQPVLKDGHTFARNQPGAQKYTLKHIKDLRYDDGHMYLNPNGLWYLEPVKS